MTYLIIGFIFALLATINADKKTPLGNLTLLVVYTLLSPIAFALFSVVAILVAAIATIAAPTATRTN